MAQPPSHVPVVCDAQHLKSVVSALHQDPVILLGISNTILLLDPTLKQNGTLSYFQLLTDVLQSMLLSMSLCNITARPSSTRTVPASNQCFSMSLLWYVISCIVDAHLAIGQLLMSFQSDGLKWMCDEIMGFSALFVMCGAE